MNKYLFQQNFIYITACLVIGAGMGIAWLPGADDLLVNSAAWALPQWIAAAILLLLCGWFTRLAGDLQRGLWTGYLQTTLLAAWLTLGTAPALGILCVGSVGAMLWRYGRSSRKWRTQRVLRETAGRICIGGGGVLLASGIYAWVNTSTPLVAVEEPRLWGVLIAAAVAQFIAMRGIGTLITGRSLAAQRKRLSPLLEAGLGLVGVALPVVFYGAGVVAFSIVAGLLVAQAQRYRHLQQTEDTLHESQHKMAVLNNLGRELSAHADLDTVLCLIYQQMQHFIDATGFFIALYDADDERITYPLVYEHDERVAWESRSFANGLTDTVIERNETVLYNDSDATGSITPNRAVRAYLGVPLSIGEKRVGVMGVTHDANPHAFDQTDLALLETIASQVSLVVRNAVLYQQTVNTADKLTRINDSLREVMFNLDREAALQAACEIALQLSEGAWAAIYLVEPQDPTQLQPAQAIGYDVAALSALSPSFPTDTITVQQNALPQHTGDSLCAPLRSGRSLAGLLVICHDTPYTLHALERNLLDILTSQIVAALENGAMLGELENYAAEQAKLVHLSRISSSNLDIERIARDVSEALEQMLHLSQVEIATYLPSERLLRFYHTEPNGIHVTVQNLPRAAVPEFDAMMRAKFIADMRTYHADHAADDEHSDALQQRMQDRAHASLTVVPLLLNREANGLLLLQSDTPHTLSRSDERLLELATHQIAAQVHNARIHMLTEEALVQRLEQLSLIEQIAQQIAQARDADLIIDSVLDAAMQATQADLCALALPDPDNDGTFDVVWKTASAWREPHRTLRLEMGEGIVGQVMTAGKYRIIPDNHQLEQYIAPPDASGEYRSSLAVPLRKGDAIIGVLNLESKQPDFFTQEQAGFMQSLAGHTAISIANATLLAERQQQINTLTLLRALSLETVRALDQQRIERAILKTALILLEGSQSALFRVDPQTGAVHLSQGVQHTDGHIEAAHPAMPDALLRRVIADNDISVIHNIHGDDAFATVNTTYTGVVALPIKRRGAIREVLTIFFDEAFAFGEQERTTVELVRAQAASHLENAALNEAIRTSNDRMRAILDSTRDGIILLDERGYLQDTNRAAEDLLDLRLHAYIGEEFSAIVAAQPSTSALREMVETYTEDPHEVHEKVYELIADEDTSTEDNADADDSDVLYIKVLVSDVRQMDDERNGRLLILRDITEETRVERFREEFQRMIIHDLRGPLGSIASALTLTREILKEDLPDGDVRDTTLTTMGVSVDSATKLMNLVDTLHDLPTITELTIKPEMTDVHTLAQQALDALSMSLQQAEINVHTDFPDALKMCYADADLIRRVFTNLLHNAIKFTPADGDILLAMDDNAADADFVRVLVCDTGPGIPDDMRETVFQQGVQVEGRMARTGERGSGLGLSLCKLAVEAHGGEIWIEPDGRLSGACFAFTLPHTPPPLDDTDDTADADSPET